MATRKKKLHFTKMHGAGNDFILLNAWDHEVELSRHEIAKLCDRRFGIGSDGLMVLRQPQAEGHVRMSYYNADGGEAEMCGNGARCFARFAKRSLGRGENELAIETVAGIVRAGFENEEVRLAMTTPRDWREPFVIKVGGESYSAAFVNTGVPHAVLRVFDLDNLDVRSLGSALRHHEEFSPAGTNVNFFDYTTEGRIALRTYERGVEDETLACGTGVVATALVAERFHGARLPLGVRVKGGDTLRVEKNDGGTVFLIGPATFVFDGVVELQA